MSTDPVAAARGELFERQRPRLRGLAYRMLGSLADADDALQDAYLRWHAAAERGAVEEPAAWLTTVVTRLCIDRLRAGAAERAAYTGPWLPEPWPDAEPALPDSSPDSRPDARQDRADDLSIAFLLLLERLAPEERAALLLRDAFDFGYPAVAAALGKSEPACRQMVRRARERVREGRPRFAASDAERRDLLDRFMAAWRDGDEARIVALLAPEATLTSDGGGKAWAALNVIRGAHRIARLASRLARKPAPGAVAGAAIEHRAATLNGGPAVVGWAEGRPQGVTAVEVAEGRIVAVYRVLNPDKLRALARPR